MLERFKKKATKTKEGDEIGNEKSPKY